MDSKAKLTINLGEICLITETGNKKLDLVIYRDELFNFYSFFSSSGFLIWSS
jgi:hypothetical protein